MDSGIVIIDKNYLKWIIDRNIKVKWETIKFLGKNTEENLYDLWVSQRFLRQYILN